MTHYLLGGHADGVAYPESNGPAREHGKPVVVIDPEDREQVERLIDALADAERDKRRDYIEENSGVMQAALREFANPKQPKPEEPMGLGAVVRDEMGRLWVRSGKAYSMPNWRTCGGDDWTEYEDIRVADVLAPGVTD